MIIETYKPIEGYEDLYEVSNLGNVRTLRDSPKLSRLSVLKPKPLKRGGHLRVQLYKDKKGKDFLIHRLVAQTFIENLNNYPCINHKDSNPQNNNVDNLEWCTYAYNNEYSFQHKEKKNNIFVTLTNKETGKEIEFNSMSKASQFLSHSVGWISNAIKKGHKLHDENYDITIQEKRK